MIYETEEIVLKDGTKALFRAPLKEDAEEMLNYLKTVCGETEFLANYPEDIKFGIDGERDYIEKLISSPDNLMIVCTVNGKIAGNCQIVFSQKTKTRHRATLMIAILKKYWGNGIGTKMFEEMENAAKQRGVTQLELQYIEGNERAAALYKKAGFKEVAELPDMFKFADGTFKKEIYMRKLTERN